MDYEIVMHPIGSANIAEIKAEGVVIANERDAVDLLGNCNYQGAQAAVLYQHQLPPAFFDLKTRLAGEVLQKFSNYASAWRSSAEFSQYNSDSLRRFINESNRAGEIISWPRWMKRSSGCPGNHGRPTVQR